MLTRVLSVQAVHFDLDGVLIESAASITRAWRWWAADVAVEWAALEPHIEGRLAVDTIRAVRPDLTAGAVQAEADRVNAYQVADEADTASVAGMVDLVRSLAGSGRPWSVVTGAPRELAAARLARCGYPAPAVLVGAEDVARGKPDPEGYLVASERLGVPAERSLVVEDSAAGVAAGRAAGAAVLAVARAGGPVDGAALTVRDGRDVRFRVDGDTILVEPVDRRDATAGR